MIEGKAIYKNYIINYSYKNKDLGLFLIIKIYDRFSDNDTMAQLYEIEFPITYESTEEESMERMLSISVDDILGIVRNYFIYKEMFNIYKTIVVDDKEYEYYLNKSQDFSNNMFSHNIIELKFREKKINKLDVTTFVSKFIPNVNENWQSIKLGAYISSNDYLEEDSITTEYLLLSDIVRYSHEQEVENLIRESVETDEICDEYLNVSFI